MQVSVIIPTYNRSDGALRTLESLCTQTLSPDLFQAIVVDDGSVKDMSALDDLRLPINYKFLRKVHAGATLARNYGVQESRGDILVFIDDDVTVSSQTLEAFTTVLETGDRIIAMGTLIPRCLDGETQFAKIVESDNSKSIRIRDLKRGDEYVHFAQCNTQLLAVRRTDFFALGMLQDPTGGWPNWDDVDFGYRAHLDGYRLLRVGNAIGEHWDNSLGSLESSSQRWFRASKSAARLFQRHPDLSAHIPMYHDKTPIVWKEDDFRLVVRKIIRRLASSRMSIIFMQSIVRVLENHYPQENLLKSFYRWIMGAYMFQGYQQGLRELNA